MLHVGPARSESVRAHNLGLVLRAVAAAAEPISRASLASSTGLTRASVSGLVDALVAGRLLRGTGAPTRAGVGRPATGLALDPSGAAGLGLELNVDHLAACVVDLTGAVRVRRTVNVSPGSGPLAQLASLAASVLREAAARGVRPSGAAVAVPGLVDPATGLLLVAPNLGAGRATSRGDGRPAQADPHGTLGALPGLDGVPLAIENEATLAARAEQRALGAAAPRSFLQVSGEVGIGAGLVLEGRLYRGRHGWSGELGHVTVWPGGRPCGCGSDGCLEQYAGQRAILRAASIPADLGTLGLGRPADLSGRAPAGSGEKPARQGSAVGEPGGIMARAEAGEPAMLAALTEAGQALGIALAGALNLLDLDAVVLGGLHASLAPWLIPPIETELDRRMIGAPLSRPDVRPSVLGADAAVLGAAWSVLDRVLDDPASWLASAQKSALPSGKSLEDVSPGRAKR